MIALCDPIAQFRARITEVTRRERRTRMWIVVCRVFIIIVFFGSWQAAVSSGLAKPVYFGAPLEILRELWLNTSNGFFFREGLPTLAAVAISFLLASIVGVGGGVLLHESPVASAILTPFIAAFNGMPRIALAPLTIVWFGLGLGSKLALAFSIVVFIILITTEAALRNVDRDLLNLCRSLGSSRWKTLISVKLPWALPGVFAGLRLGVLYSIISVIVNEMIASPDGLGQLIALYSNTFQISKMFAVLIFLSIFTIAADALLQRIEKKLRVW